MQPRRPHGQRAPSRLTTTWPISPAAPRPTHGWPSRTMPPPTPVPQNTPSSDAIRRAGAQQRLGVGRHLDVVAERDARAERLSTARRPSGKLPSQSGRLRALSRCPSAVVDVARRADPDAVELGGLTPAASAASRSAATIAAATSGGPPLVGVGTPRLAAHLVVGVHDDRLDLRSAEVDAAAHGASVPAPRQGARIVGAGSPTGEEDGIATPRGGRPARGRFYDGRVSADPFAVLGVAPGASGEEVAAAYRRLAKRWHPDRAAGEDAARRMAEINAAYDLVRSERWLERSGRTAAARRAPQAGAACARAAAGCPRRCAARSGASCWRRSRTARTWRWSTPTSTWASPQTLLAVTDRRLLWLLDDAPTHRVRSLRYRDVADVQQRLAGPATLGRPARAHHRRAAPELRRAAPGHRGGHRAARSGAGLSSAHAERADGRLGSLRGTLPAASVPRT